MEVQYASQIKAIGAKAAERNLDLREVSEYYHTCHAAAQRSFSHPRIPPIYHQFLAERETWNHYFGADKFPGRDPLYDCFIAALNHIEREPERHVKRESEASSGYQDEALKGRIRKLESLVLQKDFVVQSKDELLRIQEETSMANKALMCEKDRVIQVRENDIRQGLSLIKSHESTITQKNKNIQELQHTISKRNKDIQDLQNTAAQKNQRSLEQRAKDTKDTLRGRQDEIKSLENQLAHRDHVVRTLEFAYENLEKSSEERIATLWDEIKKKDEKIEELQNARDGLYLEDQKCQSASNNKKVKKERKSKVKPEPMEY